MVARAIDALKERTGSSRPSIKRYIHANNKVSERADQYINTAIARVVEQGLFVWHKGPSSTLKRVKGSASSPKKRRSRVVASPKKAPVGKTAAKKETPKPKTTAKIIQIGYEEETIKQLKKLGRTNIDTLTTSIARQEPDFPYHKVRAQVERAIENLKRKGKVFQPWVQVPRG